MHIWSQATVAQARSISILHRGIQIVQVRTQALAWRFLDWAKLLGEWNGQFGDGSRGQASSNILHDYAACIYRERESSLGCIGGFLLIL